ncbi:MAG: hypothetical protein GY715_06230 [Planctomycetes bacterium]|nr:hypothetical protein [Planctomycetota bacterium]
MRPEEDVDPMAPSFFVHATCAGAQVGTTGLLAKLRRVSDQLAADDLAELVEVIGNE